MSQQPVDAAGIPAILCALELEEGSIHPGTGATFPLGDTLTEVSSGDEGTVFDVLAHHVYREEGEYPLNVTIKDVDVPKLTVTDESQALVADAPLRATAHADTTTTGGQAALLWPEPPSSGTLASFTDEDPEGETGATAPRSNGATDTPPPARSPKRLPRATCGR